MDVQLKQSQTTFLSHLERLAEIERAKFAQRMADIEEEKRHFLVYVLADRGIKDGSPYRLNDDGTVLVEQEVKEPLQQGHENQASDPAVLQSRTEPQSKATEP